MVVRYSHRAAQTPSQRCPLWQHKGFISTTVCFSTHSLSERWLLPLLDPAARPADKIIPITPHRLNFKRFIASFSNFSLTPQLKDHLGLHQRPVTPLTKPSAPLQQPLPWSKAPFLTDCLADVRLLDAAPSFFECSDLEGSSTSGQHVQPAIIPPLFPCYIQCSRASRAGCRLLHRSRATAATQQGNKGASGQDLHVGAVCETSPGAESLFVHISIWRYDMVLQQQLKRQPHIKSGKTFPVWRLLYAVWSSPPNAENKFQDSICKPKQTRST